VRGRLRRPTPGGAAGTLLPAVLALATLWAGSAALRPDVTGGQGALGLSLLVSGVVAFQAYPVLFRRPDDGFVRRLGIPASALYAIAAARLLALALGLAAAALVPSIASGAPVGRAVAVVVAAAVTAWGAALRATSGAAREMVVPAGTSWGRTLPLAPGMHAAAPLLFAPLGPLLLGGFAGRLAGGTVLPPVPMVLLLAALGVHLALTGAARFERAHPRFAPAAAEMAFAPPPRTPEGGLVIDRGLAGLLPRGARAVRARDATVLGRRFRGVARLGASVGIVGGLALLPGGTVAPLRGWVIAAGAVVLAAQGWALLRLGWAERDGARWLDRSVGAGVASRWLGRSAAGFGMAMALVVPVATGWVVGVPGGGAALWPLAGAAVALLASAASLAAAGR
jgi:hypothetical protein